MKNLTEKELISTAVQKGLAVVDTVRYFMNEVNRVIASCTKRNIVAHRLEYVGVGDGRFQVQFQLIEDDDRNIVGEAFVLVEGKSVKFSLRKFTRYGHVGSPYVNLYGKSVKKQFEKFHLI